MCLLEPPTNDCNAIDLLLPFNGYFSILYLIWMRERECWVVAVVVVQHRVWIGCSCDDDDYDDDNVGNDDDGSNVVIFAITIQTRNSSNKKS